MSDVETGPIEAFKRGKEWTSWAGTPADLAELAELALSLVGRDDAKAAMELSVAAPAYEATFATPDQIRRGLRSEDLPSLTELELEVSALPTSLAGLRKIAVSFRRQTVVVTKRQETTTQPVVKLSVRGSDPDWVDLAALRMRELLDKGSRWNPLQARLLTYGFLVCFGAGLGVTLGFNDDKPGVAGRQIPGLVALGGAILIMIWILLSAWVTPALELLPDGGNTRAERIKRRLKLRGGWLADKLLTALIGAAITILIERLL